MVSHDLRNPLNVAQGHLELAAERGEDEDVGRAAAALERMRVLIEDLLTLAREDSEIGEVEPVALASVAERCWDAVDTEDASLTVKTERTVLADESRLRQLLENLVRNAVEHAGPQVTVTVGDLDGGFYLADDGPGIETTARGAAGDRDSTADDGLGIGLGIVREIAEAHGWSFAVTETDAGGARFEFRGVEAP